MWQPVVPSASRQTQVCVCSSGCYTCVIAAHAAGHIKGAPNTLGYTSPEVTSQGVPQLQQPAAHAHLHKDDVWAVGVMGLLWLSRSSDMPFGPSRMQAGWRCPELQSTVRKAVMAKHAAWVSCCPARVPATNQ